MLFSGSGVLPLVGQVCCRIAIALAKPNSRKILEKLKWFLLKFNDLTIKNSCKIFH